MKPEVEEFISAWGRVPKWIDSDILIRWIDSDDKDIWVEPERQSQWESFNAAEKKYISMYLFEWVYG